MAPPTTLDDKFAELITAKVPYPDSRPKIQKVVEYLRNRNNIEKQFSPKFVSIGPIHHGNKNLKLGEKYKLFWATTYLTEHNEQPYRTLYRNIANNISELKGLFADDVLANTAESLNGFRSLEEKLSWMLFVDGCFLLYILINVNLDTLGEPVHANIEADQFHVRDNVNIDVDQISIPYPVNIKVIQLILVKKDVLLLENQLPYQVLKLLWINDNENELIDTMKNFLKCFHWATPGIQGKLPNEPQTPTHLLDLQRQMILTKSYSKTKKQRRKYSQLCKVMTYRNIEDLTAIGIKLKSSGTRTPTDVDFTEGWLAAELTLPEIVVDDTTVSSFLNLIAYEMCPDFENDYGICSYLVFMDSLIDHADDVKKLRLEGILGNYLGRDEEVADLFNDITTDLIYNPQTYFEVKARIHEYRFNKWKIWLALGYYTYFSTPWAITGFLAAFTALALTFLQTWFSVFPR